MIPKGRGGWGNLFTHKLDMDKSKNLNTNILEEHAF